MTRKYLNAAQGQPCVRCHKYGGGSVVSAHYQGRLGHRLGKGMGIKCDDLFTADLCHDCHDIMDGRVKSDLSPEERSGMFALYILLTQARRRKLGLITLVGE